MTRLLVTPEDMNRVHVDTKAANMLAGYLLAVLSEHTLVVDFVKKDGAVRTMRCTRNPLLVPLESHPKDGSLQRGWTATLNEAFVDGTVEFPSTLNVYDLELKAWRSFTVDRVVKVHGENI